MGYTTEFRGRFDLDKPLDDETYDFLVKLSRTRRVKRNMPPEYGIEGELYVDAGGFMGQDNDGTVVDHNRPPRTQPGLWCQWTPTDDHKGIEWDGNEKFYAYVEWLEYIIAKILIPKGYVLNGTVRWRGEDFDDTGTINVTDNLVSAIGG